MSYKTCWCLLKVSITNWRQPETSCNEKCDDGVIFDSCHIFEAKRLTRKKIVGKKVGPKLLVATHTCKIDAISHINMSQRVSRTLATLRKQQLKTLAPQETLFFG